MSVEASKAKVVQVIQPAAAVNGAAFSTVEVDTLGFNYVTIYVALGATDVAATLLAVQESDTSGSGFTDIAGTRFGTDANDLGQTSTLPAATDDGKIFAIDLDLRSRKRYLDLNLTAASGTVGMFAVAWCVLSRGNDVPVTASDRGVSQIMRT